MIELIHPTDQRLNLRAVEVSGETLKSQSTQLFIDEMLMLASGERDADNPDRKTLVGLAASQVGILRRVIIIDTAADPAVPNFTPSLEVFVNPRIVNASSSEVLGREGCYSTGHICGAVFRPEEVEIQYLDRGGVPKVWKSKNAFQARIFQHEIDHLDGIRFPDRVRRPEHLHRVDEDEFGRYRTEWATWSKYVDFGEWLLMKSGTARIN